jgi:phosphoribosylaminoimidazole-succinocarboxamide synthase
VRCPGVSLGLRLEGVQGHRTRERHQAAVRPSGIGPAGRKIVGTALAKKIKKVSLELYQRASLHALSKGIIIADTKFEFGLDKDELVLVDEVFTPDSSRFWPLATYAPGKGQPSLDKQFVRDYLESTKWDKKSDPPALPPDIIKMTSQKYLEIYKLLTGKAEL